MTLKVFFDFVSQGLDGTVWVDGPDVSVLKSTLISGLYNIIVSLSYLSLEILDVNHMI